MLGTTLSHLCQVWLPCWTYTLEWAVILESQHLQTLPLHIQLKPLKGGMLEKVKPTKTTPLLQWICRGLGCATLAPTMCNPILAKCENTPKVGDLEPSGTPECLEFDNRGQNTSYWGVLNVIGKVLKCKCPEWPGIGHLNIYSPSYGQKKGRESNWQFDSQPLKVGKRPLPNVRI